MNGKYGDEKARTHENRPKQGTGHAVAQRERFQLKRKNIQEEPIGDCDEQFCQSSAVNASPTHKQPGESDINWNGEQVENSLKVRPAQSLHGSKRDNGEGV